MMGAKWVYSQGIWIIESYECIERSAYDISDKSSTWASTTSKDQKWVGLVERRFQHYSSYIMAYRLDVDGKPQVMQVWDVYRFGKSHW